MTIRAMLWDCDGVLQHRRGDLAADLEVFGTGFAEELFDAEIPALRGQESLRECVHRLLSDRGHPQDIDDVLAIWDGFDLDPEALDVVARVRAAGVACYLATNQQDYRIAAMRARGYDDHVDGSFYSAELGAMKPEPEFFAHVIQILGVPADEIGFVDDVADNVEAAKALGIKAIRHDPASGARGLQAAIDALLGSSVASFGGPSSEYDTVIAFTRNGDEYHVQLSDDWAIGEAINGGLLMALSGACVSDFSPVHKDVLSYSGIFLSPGEPGEAVVRPTILRWGRSMTSAELVVSQGDSERFRALVTLGDLAKYAEPVRKTPDAPRIPRPEDCVSGSDAPPSVLTKTGFLRRFDVRLAPQDVGWAVGAPSGRGEMNGWIRLIDGREPDANMLLMILDAFPPVAFDLGSVGWVPTIEFTGYVRAVPAPGWLQVRLSTSTVTGGLLEEDAQVWDSTGRLVAHSRQLASARFA